MKRFLFTGILLIGLIVSYGQDTITTSLTTKVSTEKLEKPNSIFVAPFNLLDFINPNFQIGYERFVAKKWAIQIEAGIIINHSIENYLIDCLNGIKVRDCPYTNKGFRVKTSVKYVVFGRKRVKLYVSPELFYMRNKSGILRSFSVSDFNFNYPTPIPSGATGYHNFFYNDEQKMGINFKFGIKLLFGKWFLLEPHVGLGLAYRIVTQTGRDNPNDRIIDSFGIFDNAAPNKLTLTFPLNIKIGCRF
jgi:hypothetical protein